MRSEARRPPHGIDLQDRAVRLQPDHPESPAGPERSGSTRRAVRDLMGELNTGDLVLEKRAGTAYRRRACRTDDATVAVAGHTDGPAWRQH